MKVREFDKRTADTLCRRGRITHDPARYNSTDNCSSSRPCEGCTAQALQVVEMVRQAHETYVGRVVSDLLHMRCDTPHPGSND